MVQYKVVDITKPNNFFCYTPNYGEAIHEYLSQIFGILYILDKAGVKCDLNKLNIICNHIHIQVIHDSQSLLVKHTPFVVENQQYDFTTGSIGSINTLSRLCSNYILSRLNQQVAKVTTFTPIKQSTPKSTPKSTTSSVLSNIKSSLTACPKIVAKRPSTGRTPLNYRVSDIEKDEDDSSDSECSFDIDPDELKQQIEELQKLKDEEMEKVNQAQEEVDEEMEKFAEKFDDLNDQKRFLRKEKEREEEKKRIFESDKSVYAKIKQHIEEGRVDENKIPILFAEKYPIFKFMDNEGLLGKEDDYTIYKKLYTEMVNEPAPERKTYVPHNIAYLSKEEQDKYVDVADQPDTIDEFISQNSQVNNKSCEQVLDDISSDSESSDHEDVEIDIGVDTNVEF